MKFSHAILAITISTLNIVDALTACPKYVSHPSLCSKVFALNGRNRQSTALQMSVLNDNNKASATTTKLQVSTLYEETVETTLPTDETPRYEKTYLDDGFVFGLEGSGISRPKGKTASLVVDGDSLETKPYQVAMVSITAIAHACFMGNAIAEMLSISGGDIGLTAIRALSLMFGAWVAADFGSGVLHWSVDNYGNGRTPVMGSIIAAFQGHHSAPWTITQRGFCNNVYKLCIPFGIPTMLLINAITGPMTTLFFTVFCVFEILSQELHKWSHMTKSETPQWVSWLQNAGLSIGRREHGLHHNAPYEGNYCIISGFCNKALDESGFFRRLEHIVYKYNGVESNAWKLDPELRAKTLSGKYSLE